MAVDKIGCVLDLIRLRARNVNKSESLLKSSFLHSRTIALAFNPIRKTAALTVCIFHSGYTAARRKTRREKMFFLRPQWQRQCPIRWKRYRISKAEINGGLTPRTHCRFPLVLDFDNADSNYIPSFFKYLRTDDNFVESLWIIISAVSLQRWDFLDHFKMSLVGDVTPLRKYCLSGTLSWTCACLMIEKLHLLAQMSPIREILAFVNRRLRAKLSDPEAF